MSTEDTVQPDDQDMPVGTQLFEVPPEEVVAEGGSEEAPATEPEPKTGSPEPETGVDPKIDPSRFEYWQSVADKRNKRLEELEPLAPLARLIDEDPEILPEIEKVIIQRKQRQAGPEKPAVPVKPDGFDEAEAFTDPASVSWKYRKEKEQYQERLLEYYDQRELARAAAEAERQQRQLALEKQAANLARLRVELTARGIPESEHDDFVRRLDTPGAVTFDHLVELYKIVKSGSTKVTKKVADMETRKVRESGPPPVGVEGGEPEVPRKVTDDQLFNDSLLAAGKRKK